MVDLNNPNDSSNDRQLQLKAVLYQLNSGWASESWRGMDQVRLWLIENSEDREVYELLLDAVQKNRNVREQIRSLLSEMKGKGSKLAEEALSRLPSNVQDLTADADDAYYAGEYKQSIELYRKVLRVDPENVRAGDQLAKAVSEVQAAIELNPNLPREAVQYYRQARSYIAARDFLAASKLLAAAIEASEERGNKFPDAEQLLSSVQNSLIADGFKKRANIALEKNQLRDALDLYGKAIALDQSDEILKKEIKSIQDLIQAENELRKKGTLKILAPLSKLQEALDAAKGLTNSNNSLLKEIEKQVYQIKVSRWFAIALVLIISVFFLFNRTELSENKPVISATSETQIPVLVIIIPTSTTIIPVITNSFTITPTIIISTPIASTSTEVSSPTSTLNFLGIGYVKLALVTARDNPNGKSVERLGLYQTVTILEQRDVGGSTWYRCTWESINSENGYWVLAEYISLGRPPRPASTPTP